MNLNLTISFLVDNNVREKLLLKNPLFNNEQVNKKVFFLDSYTPTYYNQKYSKYSENNIEETIRNNIETEISLILKPEEQIQMFFPLSNLENDAYVNIEFIKNITNSFENSNIFEKRLIVKKTLNNDDIFLDNIIVSNYFYNIKDLIFYLYNEKSINYSKGLYNINDILFLSEFGNIKDISKYSYFLDDENINKKEKLQLGLEIIKKYYMNMDLDKVDYYINKSLELEKNSINMNYFYGELKSSLLRNKDAISYYQKCLELNESKTYYKEENIPKSLKGYLIHYAIGLSYKKLKYYKEAHDSFKKCLEINPNFEYAKDKIKETVDIAKNENYFPYDKITELQFSCQSCGNCCKHFDVNITDYDIARILEKRPDLQIDDFIQIIEPRAKSEVENLKLEDKQAMVILKHKENSKECIFLTEDNKCSIHEFKPIGCRTWPFTLNFYNADVKWNNLFRPFLKNKCAHKLEENSNDENFIRENIEKLLDHLNTYRVKVKEWNKKSIDYLNKDNLLKYLIPNKKDISLYNDLIEAFKNFQEVKLIVESPFYSIHEFNFKEGYKFIEIICNSNEINNIDNIDTLIKIRDSLNVDFVYYSKFPIDSLRFYRNGSIVHIYFSKIEDFELYEESSIIYKNIEKDFEKRTYEFLFNRELEKFKNIFELKKNEAFNLINISNFENSNKVLTSITWEIIIPLLYILNKKTFHPDTVSTLKKSTNNLVTFINEFEKYEKNELSQKRLYFIVKNILEELFSLV